MENNLLSTAEVQLRSFTDNLRPDEEDIRKELYFGYSWDGKTALFFNIRSGLIRIIFYIYISLN